MKDKKGRAHANNTTSGAHSMSNAKKKGLKQLNENYTQQSRTKPNVDNSFSRKARASADSTYESITGTIKKNMRQSES